MDFARFQQLSTPLVADACMRLGLPPRVAPAGLSPIDPEMKVAGAVLPTRHYGSVDVFLEAYEAAEGGEIMVIDNGGRSDEGCIGDLTVLEARAAGLSAIAVWGLHRDSTELAEISFPVFSYGSIPTGPARLDTREEKALVTARFGDFEVGADDAVFLDSDGGVFAPREAVEALFEVAEEIHATERRQAALIESGQTLRLQLAFAEYMEKHRADPAYSFREHLRSIGGEIEE